MCLSWFKPRKKVKVLICTATGASTFVKSKGHTVTQASAHSALAHDTPSILNPYYALAFIMRIS
jgi:hypothetical protein